ncbi:40S ribosomal protein S15 [Hordeum vulgare]|nr:40S ribosomal protein S15 [Hordeum vulgare]
MLMSTPRWRPPVPIRGHSASSATVVWTLDALVVMSSEDLISLFATRGCRRFSRGLKRKPMALVKKLSKAI